MLQQQQMLAQQQAMMMQQPPQQPAFPPAAPPAAFPPAAPQQPGGFGDAFGAAGFPPAQPAAPQPPAAAGGGGFDVSFLAGSQPAAAPAQPAAGGFDMGAFEDPMAEFMQQPAAAANAAATPEPEEEEEEEEEVVEQATPSLQAPAAAKSYAKDDTLKYLAMLGQNDWGAKEEAARALKTLAFAGDGKYKEGLIGQGIARLLQAMLTSATATTAIEQAASCMYSLAREHAPSKTALIQVPRPAPPRTAPPARPPRGPRTSAHPYPSSSRWART